MARYRTLALIIVLPILATVITAFRVRDLPKSAIDSVTEQKLSQKSSVKIDSAKNYEELKKAVREKQQLINQKAAEVKTSSLFKIVSDSDDDDDDDDDLDDSKSKVSEKINISPKLSKIEKTTEPKSVKHLKHDFDDENGKESKGKVSKNKVNEVTKKTGVKTNQSPKEKQMTLKLAIGDDTDDDDDDDDDEDDDDDNDDDNSKSKALQSNIDEVKNKINTKTKQEQKGKAKPVKPVIIENDDNDSDDDDDEDSDDDDDNDLILKKSLKQKVPVQSENIEKRTPKKDIKVDDKKHDLKPNENKLENKAKLTEVKAEEKKSITKEAKPTVESVAKKPESSKEKLQPALPTKKEHIEIKAKLEVQQKKEEPQKHKESGKEPSKGKSEYVQKPKVDEVKKSEKKPTPVLKDTIKHTDSKESGEIGHKKETDKGKKEKHIETESKETAGHMDQLTDMLHRRNMLQSEFEDLYAFLPTFAPNFSRIHNPECRRHGQILLRQLRGTKLWALNMLDASAKIPSGILQGNGIQLGDFDQCLGSRARVQLETGSVVKVQGKYCLARLDVKAEQQELEVPVYLAQAKNLIRSRIDDPGHFVPRFSTLSWGVCVPSPCNPEDAEVVIKDSLKHYQHTSGLVVRVKVDERDCHTHDVDWDEWLELPTVLTLSLYGVVILLVLAGTVQDYWSSSKIEESQSEEADDKAECDQKEGEDEETGKGDTIKSTDGFLTSFSLYRTIAKLTAPGTDDDISCIHGIRGLATIALLIAHKFLPVAVTPYNNRLKITEMVSSPIWSWCRAGWMYTDCFLLLSGALTAHRISADGAGAPKRLFSRYIRLTPALLAVVLFYAYIWDLISVGPMWGTLVTKNAEVCQESWWWNLLYVQNWFSFEDMCAPQTHQLALDMQLTVIGCMIVWVMQVKPGLSKLLLATILGVAAYSRYSTVAEHRLTLLAYHGVSVSQLYRTARLSYTSVLHRCTPYLVGLSLGIALQKPSQMNKVLLMLGWLSSAALWGLVWWAGLDSGHTQYRYNATFAAQYAALAPIAASMAIAWVIYAVHNGHCEFLFSFLCWRPLVLISRLSYALYLCQFIVYITKAATVRTTSEFSIMSLIDLQEISLIMLSSTILTLTFVIPMQSLHKIFTFSSSSGKEDEKEETDDKTTAEDQKDSDDQSKEEQEEIDTPQVISRQLLVAHREILEEIPEAEIEYEVQREKNEGLEEILEEEEEEADDDEVRENHLDEEDLEIIEEEQGGEDDFWGDRGEDYVPRRAYPANDDEEDIDEWEWTANGSRNGAQHYRYTR